MSHARRQGRRPLAEARRAGCLAQAVDAEGEGRAGDRMQRPSEVLWVGRHARVSSGSAFDACGIKVRSHWNKKECVLTRMLAVIEQKNNNTSM